MTDANIKALGNEIARQIAPWVIEQNNRALLRELEQIKPEPTGMDRIVRRRDLEKFLQRGLPASQNGEDDNSL